MGKRIGLNGFVIVKTIKSHFRSLGYGSEETLIDTLDYSTKEIKKVKKNKFIIILLTIVITILSIVILDTIQAIVFKNSPIISWRIEDANDSDSYVDKGILIDTYYCVSDDVITVIPTLKNTNYNCPSE